MKPNPVGLCLTVCVCTLVFVCAPAMPGSSNPTLLKRVWQSSCTLDAAPSQSGQLGRRSASSGVKSSSSYSLSLSPLVLFISGSLLFQVFSVFVRTKEVDENKTDTSKGSRPKRICGVPYFALALPFLKLDSKCFILMILLILYDRLIFINLMGPFYS